MGLLSGLSNLGLGKLEEAKIYEDEEEKEVVQEEVKKEPSAPAFNELDVLFDKSYECPVCGSKFTSRTVRTGKARLIGQDPDLRPRYDKFEPAKYEVVVCPSCGYAVLSRYFQALPQVQIKLLKDNICGKVKGIPNSPVYTFDEAIQRYQLALASTIVKKGKDSEKGYICLKMAWIIRAKKESIADDAPNYDEIMNQLRMDENEALKGAYEGFIAARQKETFPIAGMDEMTLDYIMAVLSARFSHYDVAQKLVGAIITSKVANERIKERARELREQIKIEMEMAN